MLSSVVKLFHPELHNSMRMHCTQQLVSSTVHILCLEICNNAEILVNRFGQFLKEHTYNTIQSDLNIVCSFVVNKCSPLKLTLESVII